MNKIINYFYYKVTNKTIKIALFVLLIQQFLTFFNILKSKLQFNLYDIVIYQFNYTSLFFILSVVFLVIIYNVSHNTKFNQYLILRLNNKKQCFNMNVIVIFLTAFLYVAFFNILSIIEGIGKSSLNNTWSQFFIEKNTGSINVLFSQDTMQSFLKLVSPVQYTIFLDILVFFYFFTLGLLFLMINSLINKRQITLILAFGVVCLNMALDSIAAISPFTFTNNIFILTSNNSGLSNCFCIYVRLIYWIALSVILYIIGLKTTLRKDYNFGD